MRLIDADILFDAMEETEWYNNADRDEIAERLIVDAPSIEIIRCGECKYWIDDRKVEEDMGTCGLTHYFTNADDFCSYGMRNADSNTLNTLDALDDNSSEKPNNSKERSSE